MRYGQTGFIKIFQYVSALAVRCDYCREKTHIVHNSIELQNILVVQFDPFKPIFTEFLVSFNDMQLISNPNTHFCCHLMQITIMCGRAS